MAARAENRVAKHGGLTDSPALGVLQTKYEVFLAGFHAPATQGSREQTWGAAADCTVSPGAGNCTPALQSGPTKGAACVWPLGQAAQYTRATETPRDAAPPQSCGMARSSWLRGLGAKLLQAFRPRASHALHMAAPWRRGWSAQFPGWAVLPQPLWNESADRRAFPPHSFF